MSPLAALKDLLGRTFQDEEGEAFTIELLPPCSEFEIESFAKTLPCPLPDEIRELLAFARGFFGGPAELVTFMGDEGLDDGLLCHAIAMSPDGLGNYWVVDLTPESTVWGPIYFWCHDPPVLTYQCADLTEYLIAVKRMCTSPQKNPIDDVSMVHTWTIWQTNPGLIPQPQAVASSDAVLSAFAATLESDWVICDLRAPKIGEGFSWGRGGADGNADRDGTRPIFAYRLPPKRSFWQRLGFGGSRG